MTTIKEPAQEGKTAANRPQATNMGVDRGMKTITVLIKKILKKADHIIWSIFLFGLTPKMIPAITTRSYKVEDETARSGDWQDFKRNAQGKNVILLGLDGVSTDFIAKYQNRFSIACIYMFMESQEKPVTEYRGIPVKNIKLFRPNIYAGENLYLITSSYSIADYVEILQRNGITEYYSYLVMKCKKLHCRLRRPLIRFRYTFLYQFLHRDGLFTNYIWFPIKAVLRKLHVPGIYDKSCREIQRYKNIHTGERCFIVATGPSLRVEDVEMLEGEVTFSVNGIFKMFPQTSWRPTYYCLCDPYVYLDYVKRGYVVDLDNFAKEEAFLPKRLEKPLQENWHTKKTKLIPVCYLNHLLAEKNTRLYYSDDPVWGFYNARTVACFCANLAQYMGFKEIYFLGTDCDYVTNGQHFSDEKSPNLRQLDQLKKAQSALFKAFTFLKGEMDKRGIQVYNATRGGALEVFPRVRLEDVLGVQPRVRDEDAAGLKKEAGQKGKPAISLPLAAKKKTKPGAIDVSIIMLTYNHERYIRQALDSIFEQKTSYRFEVLIGDDASTDDTAEILKEYARQYPEVIRLFLNKENVGASRNAWNLFSHARGRYISNLEGDDYWCTDDKLQRQIEYLDENPEYIGCTHACRWVDKNGNAILSIKVNNGQKCTGDYTVDDLKDGIWELPGQTGALIYRNIYLAPQNEWLKELVLLDQMQCDRSVAMALVAMGPIKCMSEVMSHYRHVVNSASSHSTLYQKNVRRKQAMIRYLYLLASYTDTLFGEHIEFDKRRELIFKNAVEDCWPNITEEDNLVLNEIIAESGNESYYRQLYSDALDEAKEKQERAVVHKIKTIVLYIPQKIKNQLVRLRNMWFSPVFFTSQMMEVQTKQILSDLREVRTKIKILEKDLAICQNKLQSLAVAKRPCESGVQSAFEEAEHGPEAIYTD